MRLYQLITAIVFASLVAVPAAFGQCAGGSCSRPSFAYTYAPAVQSPQLWDLADSKGQHWQHADPAYLASWVAERDKGASPAPRTGPSSADPYFFGAWLNFQRQSRGLGPLAYDANLASIAAANSSRGFGHHGLHRGRENVGMGALGTVQSMWLSSPLHAAALFDPGVTRYGVACVGNVWTYCAY